MPIGLLRSIDAWEAREGAPSPLGPTYVESHDSYNFALFSRHATAVTLLFYSERDFANPVARFSFSPRRNKSGRIWHCFLPHSSLNGATFYAYSIDGPNDPGSGNRFDPSLLLLDPHALAVHFPPDPHRHVLARLPRRERLVRSEPSHAARHTHDLIIYELHVKGFTARGNSGVAEQQRGTYAGLIEKIPYLLELGVTAVELLPVHQHDPREKNYWGYMTLSFFAPHQGYSAGADPAEEFKRMVCAFHDADIEVFLDVVYNHTSEGDETGPTTSFRGIDNQSYYLLTPDRAHYINDSGCGNTLRGAHPSVRGLVLESLRHYANNLSVDGFRFDLASILAKSNDGSVDLDSPPLILEVGFLAHILDFRVIAEAWDLNAYLLGRSFPGVNWQQWNGMYRDDVRDFVRGAPGKVPALMQRLYGSDDLFPDTLEPTYRPSQSVNFITAHDGFCLYDLVSYNRKRNLANGHNDTDGTDDNRSWNCGHEGDAGCPPDVMALRRRQVRNYFALLMLSNGTPMFCAGDEFLNTQRGNNNPYNQDNEITWLDWSLLEKNREVFRFFQRMIAFRKAHPSIGRSCYWREDVHWYGTSGAPDLASHSHSLAYYLDGSSLGDDDLYVMINAWWEPLTFRVQEGEAGQWRRVVDTSLDTSSDGIVEPGSETAIRSLEYTLAPRSVAVLVRPAV